MPLKLTFEEMYGVLGTKSSEYEGAFITAVKTTGIFCRPSCRARKPNAENVTFYSNTQEALRYGFRPCKVCKPMDPLDQTPQYISQLLSEIQAKPFERIKDYDLKTKGLDPAHIRRWFQKNHKITFHGYQRMIRLNYAYKQIKEGQSVTHTAYDSGYESLSGFSDGFKSIFGETPSKGENVNIINIKRFTTPLGPMYACATEAGLCLLEFTDRRMLETEFKDLRKRLKAVILPGENKILEQTEKELKEYFEGALKEFNIPIQSPGTEFQQKVWNMLKKIPYGDTRSYKEQAIKLGDVKAIRAVATANGMNKIAIIIPCHRVIGSDGSLTGYAGGLERKRWLLDHEKKNSGQHLQGTLDLIN